MKALIDGDMVAFRAAASCEPTKAKDYLEALDVALLRCEDLINRILQETEAASYHCYLGGGKNFRHEIYPEYKAKRSDRKPEWLEQVREHIVLMHPTSVVEGIESDDAMGIEQEKVNGLLIGDEYGHFPDIDPTIIVTNDKDLMMIPGYHYNPTKPDGQREVVFVDKLTGLKYFYQQLIQGDQVDNIPGYDGKMRPKIPKFLQTTIDCIWEAETEREMYLIVHDLYEQHNENPEEIILRNGQLLWIQRKEGDEWHPPE